MRRVERLAGLPHELGRALGLEGPLAPQELAQVDAVHVRHGQVEDAAVVARGDRPHDVRMVERRRELRLAQEALPEPLVVRELGREQLQRHRLPSRSSAR